MLIDFFAREPHHKEHALAIYNALPPELKGDFIVNPADLKRLTAVFCYKDLKAAGRAGVKTIYSDHGAGFYFNTEHPSYAGSTAFRDSIVLRLSPNENHAKKEREVLDCPVEVIGVPKLDKYFKTVKPVLDRPYKRKKVAVSFHWDCKVNWATSSAYRYYIDHLWRLTDKYEVIGHGHPRIINKLAKYYQKQGIKVVTDFGYILKNADVYINDSSSTLFEFAAMNKPVVLLNCPNYNKLENHEGCPRFWKHANIGPQVDTPDQLLPAVEEALNNRGRYLPQQRIATEEIFSFTDGECAQRAVQSIIKHLQRSENV